VAPARCHGVFFFGRGCEGQLDELAALVALDLELLPGAVRAGQGDHRPAQVVAAPVPQAQHLQVLHQPLVGVVVRSHPAVFHPRAPVRGPGPYLPWPDLSYAAVDLA